MSFAAWHREHEDVLVERNGNRRLHRLIERTEAVRAQEYHLGGLTPNLPWRWVAKRIALLREEINQYYWDFFITSDLVELRNLALVAELIIDSAILRKESRGIHYSLDYLQKKPTAEDTLLKKRTILNPQ